MFLLAKLNQGQRIIKLLLEPPDTSHRLRKGCPLFQHFLSTVSIIPQLGIFSLRIKIG